MGMIERFARFKGFLETVRQLNALFEGADRNELKAAFAASDFKGACKAMKVSEGRMVGLLQNGAREASKIAREEPELAVEALRQQHPADGSRH